MLSLWYSCRNSRGFAVIYCYCAKYFPDLCTTSLYFSARQKNTHFIGGRTISEYQQFGGISHARTGFAIVFEYLLEYFTVLCPTTFYVSTRSKNTTYCREVEKFRKYPNSRYHRTSQSLSAIYSSISPYCALPRCTFRRRRNILHISGGQQNVVNLCVKHGEIRDTARNGFTFDNKKFSDRNSGNTAEKLNANYRNWWLAVCGLDSNFKSKPA